MNFSSCAKKTFSKIQLYIYSCYIAYFVYIRGKLMIDEFNKWWDGLGNDKAIQRQ